MMAGPAGTGLVAVSCRRVPPDRQPKWRNRRSCPNPSPASLRRKGAGWFDRLDALGVLTEEVRVAMLADPRLLWDVADETSPDPADLARGVGFVDIPNRRGSGSTIGRREVELRSALYRRLGAPPHAPRERAAGRRAHRARCC
jgi:hypothetical protein